MYQLTVRLTSRAGKTHDMIEALRLVTLPARFEPGFRGCQIYAEAGEADSLCLLEEWETQGDFERQIRSVRFGRLLAVMETAADLPSLEVRLVSETRGWNYVRQLRGDAGRSEGSNGHPN